MFWGNLVPHMVVFRLPVLHYLHGIMTHIVLVNGDPLGFCRGNVLQTFFYKLMILCKDTDALLHVISLIDWPKHAKSFFYFFLNKRYFYGWPLTCLCFTGVC